MKSCLIVDDSRIIRKVARRILEDMDFEVSEAADGAEAMAYCRSEMPQAILLDWNMPVMDGMTFLLNLREMPRGRQPKVLFCTTENDIGRMSRALEAGADEVVMKPFDQHLLSEKLAQVGAL